MSISTKERTGTEAVEKRLAMFGAEHGYRFEGDTVHLNAMFTVLDAAAHQQSWALQLWACPVAPRHAGELSGHLIAEVALPPIGELADDTECFEVSSPAWTPPSRAGQFMVLALVASHAGSFGGIHDFAVYPVTEWFLQPRISGNAAFSVEGERVHIDVERIENPRGAANRSGTLALELWALAGPYSGGTFNGRPLAGVAIDPLLGQHEYARRSFDLPFVPPPAGTWTVVLMLREWTSSGYVTRDHVNFRVPYVTPAACPEPPVPAVVSAPVRTGPVPTASPTAIESRDKSPRPTRSKAVVAVNTASKQELSSVKGLPSKVVEEIVTRRPFKSLDELVKCKGMGRKLLAKLRSKLRL